MGQYTTIFLDFIGAWGYIAIAMLTGLENACIPIPSELILGFAGYLVFAGKLQFTGAITAGMVGGMVGSALAYCIGYYGGPRFVNHYGKYLLVKESHVDVAQRWFDKYGIKAVFFSRMLPIIRTFISLPAGFARVNFKKFLVYTFLGSLPWTIFILWAGMMLGENWQILTQYGHEASIGFVGITVMFIVGWYMRYKHKCHKRESNDMTEGTGK